MKIVDEFKTLAEKKGCTPGQLALAWVASQGAVPIPGTRNISRLEDNFGATDVTLSDEELKEIRNVIDEARPQGARYVPFSVKP